MNREQEVRIARMQRILREKREAQFFEAYKRKNQEKIEINLKKIEEFFLGFIHFILHALNKNSDPALVERLESSREQIELFHMFSDLLNLFMINQHHDVVVFSPLSVYQKDTKTRTINADILYVDFRSESGDSFSDNMSILTQAFNINSLLRATESMGMKNVELVIDSKGNTYRPEEVKNQLPLDTGLKKDLNLDLAIMIAWDLDHSLPLCVQFWGSRNIDSIPGFRFLFKHPNKDKNHFPILSIGEKIRDQNYSKQDESLLLRTNGKLLNGKKYDRQQKFIRVGKMSRQGEHIEVWGQNQEWEKFETS